MKKVIVIGAGLAGSEAAWQAARMGADVLVYEMRPGRSSPAHHTAGFAELVCSNSLRAAGLANAVGVLKEEMRLLGSIIMESADANAVPAGGALAVDREAFSRCVTERVESLPKVTVLREEMPRVPIEEDAVTVVATGPLTDGPLAEDIARLTGEESLYFYDAAAPIVTRESIDMEKAYFASRYGKGEAAYINCPMDREEYERFYEALVGARLSPVHGFEEMHLFEGCMPVEAMAARGVDTLRYGPMKPVGLEHPETGVRPYAVVQLRQDNGAGTLYNIVGFQTRLTWPEQRRVFGMIPGLEQAEFVRYGVMHRNTFLNSPRLLLPTMEMRGRESLLFAGQMTGVEGYVESAASGLMAGINAARIAMGDEPIVFPEESCHGALAHYITTAAPENFQPMNVNFGLLPPLASRVKKHEKKARLAERAIESIKAIKSIGLNGAYKTAKTVKGAEGC